MTTLLVVMLVAGSLGGLVNYSSAPRSDAVVHNRTLEDSTRSIWKSLTLGIAASFLVPLFLNMISSDLIAQIVGGRDGPPPEKVLVFAGFCLVAAMSSRAFIKTLSDRILNEAQAARKEAQTARETATRVEAAVDPLLEKQTESDEPESRLTERADAALDDAELKVIVEFATSLLTLRSLKGISTHTGLEPEVLLRSLSSLEAKGLVKKRPLPIGERWYITQEGLAAYRQSSAQATPSSFSMEDRRTMAEQTIGDGGI